MKTGDKVKFIGCSEDQNRWGGNNDPAKFLAVGDEVTIRDVETHTWHTKLYFIEIPGKYNSVCFEPVALPEEKKNTMENMTKEQAIKFLREYAKCGIHLNYSSQPEYKLKKMEECIAVLTSSGSVAAPKEGSDDLAFETNLYINSLRQELADAKEEISHLRGAIATMCKTIKTE